MDTSQETGFIVWTAYTGEAALLLAVLLFVVGGVVIVLGGRLKKDVRLPMPWTWLKAVILIVWVLQILILLRVFKHIATVDPTAGVTGPVLPVTIAAAVCTFVFVAYVLRHERPGTMVGSAFVAAITGPMVFELPFVLIVAPVSSVPTNPGAVLTIPFFIAMFATLAMLTFCSKSAITKYSAYFFGAMFVVFALWALLGFAYPSDPTLFALNAISKVLGFGTIASMFVRRQRMT